MRSQEWGYVAVLVVCIFLAALASGTETALTSVNRLRVRHLAEEGSTKATLLQRLQSDPNRFLSTVLVVNTFALIVASAAATLLSIDILEPHVPVAGPWRTIASFLVSIVLSIFLLVFAEVTPKTIAVRNADRIALQVAMPVDALASLLSPVLWFVTVVSRAIAPGGTHGRAFVTEGELLTLLNVSEEQGVIEQEEREMIEGIVGIGDKLVREVMVPRTRVVAVAIDAGLEEISAVIQEHGHTRIPVYERDLDHIVGLVHAKDVLRLYARGVKDFSIERILRRIHSTPEQKKVDELLHDMRQKKAHMMVVVDEYGGTAGIVTLEDVLEEIVGEIRDEYDVAEEEPLEIVSDHEALVDATRYPMDELDDRLGLGITESEEYDSVAGYVISHFGEIPQPGANFESNGVRWVVESVNGHAVGRVRLVAKKKRWPPHTLVAAGLITEEEAHERLEAAEEEE
jgi:magnesium and cobalt exporter, CNNM family